MFGIHVRAGYVPFHASTHKFNTSQWHHNGVNVRRFVSKQYKPSKNSFHIVGSERTMPSHLSTYLRE